MNLCIVRHGETAWNAEGRVQGQLDIPLSATGDVLRVTSATIRISAPSSDPLATHGARG